MAEIHHADGRIELEEKDSQALQESPLYNPDLAPVPLAKRNWTTYNFAALWISMAHCIPTYMLASGLIDSGMSWLQALFTILLGNVIGGILIDGGTFDWAASGKYPTLTEPYDGFHGMVMAEESSVAAFALRAIVNRIQTRFYP